MTVLWYVPNLIGYVRILFFFLSLLTLFHYPPLGIILGLIAQVLDAIDGTVARRLGQVSALGSILDYAVDRMFVGCWMIFLTVLYPQFWLLFVLILSFDLVSHLFHMYASLQMGMVSHKQVHEQQNTLLRRYYSHPLFMFMVCLLHDLWILAVVIYYFYPHWTIFMIASLLTPFLVFKGYLHLLQLISSSRLLASIQSKWQVSI